MSKNRADHSVLKVAFPDAHLPALKAHCATNGVFVSDFMREAALRALEASTSPVQTIARVPQGPTVFSAAVEAAARVSPGVPRHVIETATAAVVQAIHNHRP